MEVKTVVKEVKNASWSERFQLSVYHNNVLRWKEYAPTKEKIMRWRKLAHMDVIS